MESKVCSTVKTCVSCKESKALELFNKSKAEPDGLQYSCKSCQSTQQKERRQKNKEVISVYNREYRQRNIAERLEKEKRYRLTHKEARNASRRNWYTSNKEKVSGYNKQYNQENNAKIIAKGAKRRSKKMQATPKWLTKRDLDHIEMFYEAAAAQKQYGLICHVDHIVPLQGKEVCGLHVPWNLQVLPASENIRKGNRLK